MEEELCKFYPNINANIYLDNLLNRTFSKLLSQIEQDLSINLSENQVSAKRKPQETETEIFISKKEKKILNLDIITNLSKLSRRSNLNDPIAFISKDPASGLSIMWKYDTLKCVDATPLIVVTKSEDFPLIFIGSHSKQFVCINGYTGELIWKFLAQDRIESSACLSKCGNYVIFGNLVHFLIKQYNSIYILDELF